MPLYHGVTPNSFSILVSYLMSVSVLNTDLTGPRQKAVKIELYYQSVGDGPLRAFSCNLKGQVI